jgi:hypothetical protein
MDDDATPRARTGRPDRSLSHLGNRTEPSATGEGGWNAADSPPPQSMFEIMPRLT